MAGEDDNDGAQTLLFSFTKPESGWSLIEAARFFAELQTFVIELAGFQMRIAMAVVDDRLLSLNSGGNRREDIDPLLSAVAGLQLHEAAIAFKSELLAFRFNSPIDVVVKFGAAISRKTIKTVMAAHDYLVHREAISRLKHAQASAAEQDALAKKLKNLQTALKIHQGIENPEIKDRMEEMLTKSLLPFAQDGSPRLKSIELRGDDEG